MVERADPATGSITSRTSLLPDGQNVFDFGDIWEGPLTRARGGAEYDRVYPGGTLQSNFNALYRVAARLQDREAQAVAARYASFKHSNLEEYMTLLWRDPQLEAAPMTSIPLVRHFEDSGVVFARTSWESDATAFAFKAGPPEGHRVAQLLPQIPEWKLSSGHAHPDANSFIIWARGRYLTGDTGYSGLVSSRQHNTVTVGGLGQGVETEHDVWKGIPYATLANTRIVSVDRSRVDERARLHSRSWETPHRPIPRPPALTALPAHVHVPRARSLHHRGRRRDQRAEDDRIVSAHR